MHSLLLTLNGTLGLLATFLAAKCSVSSDPWPTCYRFFPLMEFAGLPGFLAIPIVAVLIVTMIVLMKRRAKDRQSHQKNAWITAHIILAAVFFIPAIYEAFGRYCGE